MKNRVYVTAVALLEREDGIRQAMYGPAAAVWRLAITHAPHRTGAYMSSIRVQRIRSGRAQARVLARDRKSMWLEYGTGIPAPSPHFEVLTRAVARAGFHRVDYVPHVRKGKRGRG